MSFLYASFWADHLLPGAHTSRSAESSSSCSRASTAFRNVSIGTWVAVTDAVRSSSGRTSNELDSNVPSSEKREEFMSNRFLSYYGRSVVEILPRHKAQRGREKAGQKHTSRTQSVHVMGQPEERPWHNSRLLQAALVLVDRFRLKVEVDHWFTFSLGGMQQSANRLPQAALVPLTAHVEAINTSSKNKIMKGGLRQAQAR